MKIRLLPPDINEGEAGFSVSPDGIRYALTAIKGVGRPVIDAIITERRLRGPYKDLRDFLTRMASQEKDVNRRTVENFIKSGALDCLGGTRKQLMSVFVRILEDLQSSKKNDMAGQMTLFDIADEEDKKDYEIRMPDVGEYPDELRLAFEKEVLGIYVSGHPLQAWEGLWKSRVTATAADFVLDEDAAAPQALLDRREAVIGGIISEKTIKYTKNGEVMAFLSIEDLTGTVEVIVFPRTYEENADALEEDNKIFIRGRISLEEEKDGKLIASKITPFEDVPRRVWLRFPNFTEWKKSMRIWLDMILRQELGQVVDWSLIDREAYLSAMERSPVNDLEIRHLLKNALTDKINDRETFMKGVDQSYYYEGYSSFVTGDSKTDS